MMDVEAQAASNDGQPGARKPQSAEVTFDLAAPEVRADVLEDAPRRTPHITTEAFSVFYGDNEAVRKVTMNVPRGLVTSILKAAGWVMLGEATTHVLSSAFKGLTLGYGTVLTAVPQGAAAGYGSFIVGRAAKYYFEHGSSWGGESPKTVVRRILQETDKTSVLDQLKEQIKRKMQWNPHSNDGR